MARKHTGRWKPLKNDLLLSLEEALKAVDAFENYCQVYAKHDISPRLLQWRAEARVLVKKERAQ